MNNILDEMPELSGKYRCKFKIYERFSDWAAMFEIVGAKGGVHYHVSRYKDTNGSTSYSSGLEFHYRTPPDYMKDKPPSHDECFLLKCPCWHDGTSLYASEVYEPMFLRGDYSGIFRQMERDAEEKFNGEGDND